MNLSTLSPREKDVFDLLLDATSNKEIGRALNISPRTAEVHRKRVLSKLGAKSANHLLKLYYQGLLAVAA